MNEEIDPPAKHGPHCRPTSDLDLFVSFTKLALQGFGGVLPVMQRDLVEVRKWLTEEEFLEDWAVAQILPGSNVFNFALIVGRRHRGIPGAVAAMAGMLVVPMIVALVLAALFTEVADIAEVRGALRGMGIVSAGLIVSTGIKLLVSTARGHFGALATGLFAAVTFCANGLLHFPLFATLVGPGAIAWLWAYSRVPAPTDGEATT